MNETDSIFSEIVAALIDVKVIVYQWLNKLNHERMELK